MESICTSRVSKVGHTDASHKNRKPVAPMMYRKKKKKKKEGGGGGGKGIEIRPVKDHASRTNE